MTKYNGYIMLAIGVISIISNVYSHYSADKSEPWITVFGLVLIVMGSVYLKKKKKKK